MIDWRKLRNPGFVSALVLLLTAGAGLSAVVSALRLYLVKAPINADLTVQSVPTVLSSWARVGVDHQESKEMIEELGTENYLTRAYQYTGDRLTGAKDSPITLQVHLAYYTGMVDTVPHVPERCMVGGGWSIAGGSVVVPLKLDQSRWVRDGDAPESEFGVIHLARRQDGTRVRMPRNPEEIGLRVTEFTQPGSEQSLFAGYFFLANGGVATSAEGVRLQAFRLSDDYAYYLKVQISSSSVGSAEELAEQATMLLDELLPEIMRAAPDWVEVQKGNYPPDNPRGKAGGKRGAGAGRTS